MFIAFNADKSQEVFILFNKGRFQLKKTLKEFFKKTMSISILITTIIPISSVADTLINGKYSPQGQSYGKTCELIYELQKADTQFVRVKTVTYNDNSEKNDTDFDLLLCKKCSKEKISSIKTFPPRKDESWSYIAPNEFLIIHSHELPSKKTREKSNCLNDLVEINHVKVPRDSSCAKKDLFHQLTALLPTYQKVDLIKMKGLEFIDFYQTCRKYILNRHENNTLTTLWKNMISQKNDPDIYDDITISDTSRNNIKEDEKSFSKPSNDDKNNSTLSK